MLLKDLIEEKLVQGLCPQKLIVKNVSESHKGHALNTSNSLESHFLIHITSEKFLGLPHIQRERLVQNILGREIYTKVHSISLHLEPSV